MFRLSVVLDELNTLLDVGLELWHHLLKLLLLEGIDLAKSMDLRHTLWAELHWRREVRKAGDDIRLHVSALDETLLALQRAEDTVSETSTGIGHREGGRSAASLALCLDDFITAKLDALGERFLVS